MTWYYQANSSPFKIQKDLEVTAAKPAVRLTVRANFPTNFAEFMFGVKDHTGADIIPASYCFYNGGPGTPATDFNHRFVRADAGSFTIGEIVTCWLGKPDWYGDFIWKFAQITLELVD